MTPNVIFAQRLTHYGFSPSEQRVANMLRQGLSNKEIGAELHITESTVKNHLSRMYTKTGTLDRLQLALRLYDLY